MAAFTQPGRRRGQPERLAPELVGRNQDDVHAGISITARRVESISVIIEGYAGRERTARMALSAGNSFGTRDRLSVGAQTFEIHRLETLEKQGITNLPKPPFSLRILLEKLLRCADGRFVRADDIRTLAA